MKSDRNHIRADRLRTLVVSLVVVIAAFVGFVGPASGASPTHSVPPDPASGVDANAVSSSPCPPEKQLLVGLEYDSVTGHLNLTINDLQLDGPIDVSWPTTPAVSINSRDGVLVVDVCVQEPPPEVVYYQVDFAAGRPLAQVGPEDGDFYGDERRLIRHLHGSSDDPVTERGSAESLKDEYEECVESEPIGVVDRTAMVTFTVEDGCELNLTLASYRKPGAGFDRGMTQQVFDADTGQFGPGNYTLAVDLPGSDQETSPITIECDASPFEGDQNLTQVSLNRLGQSDSVSINIGTGSAQAIKIDEQAISQRVTNSDDVVQVAVLSRGNATLERHFVPIEPVTHRHAHLLARAIDFLGDANRRVEGVRDRFLG
jgi:hypothetical protein